MNQVKNSSNKNNVELNNNAQKQIRELQDKNCNLERELVKWRSQVANIQMSVSKPKFQVKPVNILERYAKFRRE